MKVRSRRWHPTAAQRTRISNQLGGGYRPWGTVHLRAIGSNLTLCGLVATSWPMFYDMEFAFGHENSCSMCPKATADAGRAVRVLR